LSSESPKPLVFPFYLNFFGLIGAGVAALAWTAYFTDALPAVANLLGLGGVFAWIAFVAGFVEEERKKGLRDWLDAVLSGWRCFWTLAIAALALTTVSALYGGVKLESRELGANRWVAFFDGERKVAEVKLPAGGAVKKRFFTGLFGERSLRVETQGLPGRTVAVGSWRRVRLELPDDLLRRLVLVLPTHKVVRHALRYPSKLRIYRNGALLKEFNDYHGQAVWIGSGADTPVPKNILDAWKIQMLVGGVEPTVLDGSVSQWQRPLAAAPLSEPTQGDVFRVALVGRDEGNDSEKNRPAEKALEPLRFATSRVLADYVTVLEVCHAAEEPVVFR